MAPSAQRWRGEGMGERIVEGGDQEGDSEQYVK